MFESTFKGIGLFSARHSTAVIISWILLLLVLAPFAPSLFTHTNYNIASDIVPTNSPANIASNLQTSEFNTSNDSSFVIVTNDTSIDQQLSLTALMNMQEAIMSYLNSEGFSVNVSSILVVENNTLRSVSLSLYGELKSIYDLNEKLYNSVLTINKTLDLTANFLFLPATIYYSTLLTAYKKSGDLNVSEHLAYNYTVDNRTLFNETPYEELYMPYVNGFSLLLNNTLNSSNIHEVLDLVNYAVNETVTGIAGKAGPFGPILISVDHNLTLRTFNVKKDFLNYSYNYSVSTISEQLSNYTDLISKNLHTTVTNFSRSIVNLSLSGNSAGVPDLTSLEVYNGTVYLFQGNPLVSLNTKYLEPYLSALLDGGKGNFAQVNNTVNSTLYYETFSQYPIIPSNYVFRSFVGYGNTTEIFAFGLNKNYSISTLNHVNKIASSYVSVDPINGSYYTAGTTVLDQQIEQEVMDGLIRALIIGIVLSIVIVGLFFRSPVAAFIPFSLFLMSSIISFGINSLLYEHILHSSVSFVTPTLLLILLLGLTSDYVVYIMSRFRRELIRNNLDAIAESSMWAGHAVFTSGITVALSYIVLYLFNVPIFSDAGITNAVGVIVSVMLGNTFLIALLSKMKGKIFWPFRSKKIPMENTMDKISKIVINNKKKIVVIFVVVAMASLFVYAITPTNMDVFNLIPPSSGIQSAVVVNQSFHGDLFFTSFVILKFSSPILSNGTYNTTEMLQVTNLESFLKNQSEIANVYGPSYPYGYFVNVTNLPSSYASEYKKQISTYIGKNPEYVMVEFELHDISWSDPATSFINKLPSMISDKFGNSLVFYVGGLTAGLDAAYSHTLHTFEEMIPIITGSIFVILLIQLSSVFTPIRLILMVLASVIVGLVIIYAIVYYIYGLPIIVFMPMFTFVTLLAVGLDYDIFMITRAREGVIKGMSDEEAITTSIKENGGIIVTLGSLLFVTFGSLYFSDLQLIEEIGGGLAIGVLIDTFLSWPFFVPAVMLLMKHLNWWPSKIQKH
ncbi:membrane protein [Thermoplasma volcanium GSS1]|uniref:Membrane protein n=1 Tax=Thermoplasma volcanium (strain ATCC 51530 / DSM 4299 / JCM 9571 / NBRC 15438 / GSS1) TaxID=273116 RepID=Q979Z5_THEVO|nr:MMPL family transporter [Thermoplasma volcanium]BAB60157.1 membrane protein [Thermoplasma volcanium GSS1]